jgi:flagellar protein FliO/FliZ
MDTIALLGRVLVSLAAVLGVMWVLARRMRAGKRGRATKLIDVLGRQALSRSASVAVVRVGDKALVVGVTDNQVSVLSETDLAAAEALVAEAQAGTQSGRSRSRHAGSARTRTAAPGRPVPMASAAPASGAATPSLPLAAEPARAGALAGSALSPATWKQTLESLRDLTARTD